MFIIVLQSVELNRTVVLTYFVNDGPEFEARRCALTSGSSPEIRLAARLLPHCRKSTLQFD